MVYTCNGILFSLKKEGNPARYNNISGSGEHYAKWNKLDEDRNTIWSHLYL